MNIGIIQSREITEEMQESYLDYAMSVIVSRALPDVRDGLKPVHRRILFAMREMHLSHAAKKRKCAGIVGEVLGKYHPHGDLSVYDALVRMAQDFSLRHPLIDGQGNFGSIDGDSPAAMRYTEARLSAVAETLLEDIEKETVPFVDTYDGTRTEPTVLPARTPNLLINGSMGIAVGMATNIPPHHLGEVVDAVLYLCDHPKATTEDLMQHIQGPDFPTGGAIYNRTDIVAAYSQGRGPIVVRGIAEIQSTPRGSGQQIVISEIPYQVQKSVLLEKMAELVRDKHLEGVRDIRDESDKEGLRIALDLKQDAFPQKVLNKLYKYTDLQRTFHLNMLALVDGIQPQVLSLKGVLEAYVGHRKVVIRERTTFDFERAKERAHILEGLAKALLHIDAVIKTIKASRSKEAAHEALRHRFHFTSVQSTAILGMPLSALARLEREKIEQELKEKKRLMKELAEILGSSAKLLSVMKRELSDLKTRFLDERRTRIFARGLKEFSEADLVPEEDVIIFLTSDGYIKRMKPENFRVQGRGGKGVLGLAMKDEDLVSHFLLANTHDEVLFFTNTGRVFKTKIWEIPEASRASRGRALANILELGLKETVSAIVPLRKENEIQFLLMATRHGMVKKTPQEDFDTVRRSGLIALTLKKQDELAWVAGTGGSDQILLVSKRGQAIRFAESSIRSMGRSAAGVYGMALRDSDEVVAMSVIHASSSDGSEVVVVLTSNGFGKRTKLSQYRRQGRGGRGVQTAKPTAKTGSVVSAVIVSKEAEELAAISQRGQVIRTKIQTIPFRGRSAQGVRIMRLAQGDGLASFTVL